MTVAQQLAAGIAALGIQRVYGLPGEDHMALLDAFTGAGLHYCAAFNESSAVLMATTDAQLTGLPGVVVLSLAPGVSNGVNGLANAYLEQVPLILISGQHPADRLPFTVRQGFDIEQMVTPFTRWRARVTADMDITSVFARAVDEAMCGRQGPVYLEVPDAVATSATSAADGVATAAAQLRRRWSERERNSPALGSEAKGELLQRLGAAERPVLVVGGRTPRVAASTVDAFSRAFGAPVFTTSRQKGLLDFTAEYFAGTYLNGRVERGLLDAADLVLFVDPDSFDYYNKPWNFTAPAIALVTPQFTEWSNPIAARFDVDADQALRSLAESAPGQRRSVWAPADVRAYRNSVREQLLPNASASFSVAAAAEAALKALPPEGYLVADAGFSKPLVAMLSDLSLPGHYFASNALSTMGYTIPAAVALRRAGRSPTLAFLGDGSLMMRATELMVSLDSGQGALVYVAVMDGSLTQIEVKQERRKLATVGVRLPEVSCAALGRALGIRAVDVRTAEDLEAAVAEGMTADRPVLIGAYVDPAPSRPLFEMLRG